jgi:acyl carrier protein
MPVTSETIETTVFTALEEFGADPAEINHAARFEALEIDSLDLAELAQIVEEKYGVQIKGADMESIETVGDVIELIAARAS